MPLSKRHIVSLHVRHRHHAMNSHRQKDPHLLASSPEQLTKVADLILNNQRNQSLQIDSNNNDNNDDITQGSNRSSMHHHHQQLHHPTDDNTLPSFSTRRFFFASSLLTASTALATTTTILPTPSATAVDLDQLRSAQKLNNWKVTPINKRTGVTVYDVERLGYTVGFVTYLSRFLLCFDADCQKWWWNRAADIPKLATVEQVQQIRLDQFAAFSASVEVGLQEFKQTNDGVGGPKRLLQSLVKRYCPSMEQLKQQRAAAGLPPLSEAAEEKQEREIKEARRQIALLFGLMEQNQPVEQITQLLAAIDNGSVSTVQIQDAGSGYAPGYGPPVVQFPPPEAGEGYETATGRAILSPNGRLLRVDVVNRGMGYTNKPPTVTILPPAVIRFGAADPTPGLAEAAQAKATLFRGGGVNKGRIERIELTNPGAGYTDKEIIRIRISPPDTPVQKGGVQATATAVLEYCVTDIQILNNGTGYAVEKPIQVYVEPPPLTARVNMNDPLMARVISPNEPLPATSIPTAEMRQRMPDRTDPMSVEARVTAAAARSGADGGCIGRACYDRPVVAVAYLRAESDVFDAFRNEDDTLVQAQKAEKALVVRSVASSSSSSKSDIPAATTTTTTTTRVVSASGRDGGGGLPADSNPFVGVGPSSSSNLLALLPAGIGLKFNDELGRYELAVDKNYQDDRIRWLKESRKIDPDFGPRGRSPIERDMKLGISLYLRFVASGAVCCSAVHLALTPIDVVKTKVSEI